MNIDYCEVCGVLIQSGQGPVMLPEGVICASCFSTRRVTETQQQRGEITDGLVQFDCCYCHSLLRLKAVSKRTRVRCPKCNDAFYLHEDGRIEARLEGSKTAVLQQEDVAPLGRPEKAGDKTQPIKRADVLGNQHAMLEELKPKSLDFVDALPKRQGKVALDTGKYRRPAESAEAEGPGLSASDEGKVDLGASELRRKTQGLKAVQPKAASPKAASPKAASPKPASPKAASPKPASPKPADDSAPADAGQTAPASGPQGSSAGSASASTEPASAPRPSKLLWLAFALPLLLGVGFAAAAYQRAPFTHQGNVGRGLHDFGETLERGVRSVDSLLPAGVRMTLPDDVAPVTSR